MRGQKDIKSNKKGVNWIENQGENLYKKLKICQIIYFVPEIEEPKVDLMRQLLRQKHLSLSQMPP